MVKARIDPSLSLGRDALRPVPRELLELLRMIRKHGSLRLATQAAGISYRNAAELLGRWETMTGRTLAVHTRGRGSSLTPFGLQLAGIEEWLHDRVGASLRNLSDELARYLDVPQAATVHPLRLRASHDLAVLKLHERLAGHVAIDLRFQGGLDSLDALARDECDIAGFHLPDPPALLGTLLPEYRTRLEGCDYLLLRLLSRHQGMMVAHGNPRRIRSLTDLTRTGIRLANREYGSGTRLLFDALLARQGITGESIEGYGSEELTHMATAAAVRAGRADVAFGIEAAARAHELDFLPAADERYYLAFARKRVDDDAIDAIARAADTVAFRRAIARIGGYDVAVAPKRVRVADVLDPPAKRLPTGVAARR